MTQHSLNDFNVTDGHAAWQQYLGPAGADVAAGIDFFARNWQVGCMSVPGLNIVEVDPALNQDDAELAASSDTDSDGEQHATESDFDLDSDDDEAAPDQYLGLLVPGASLVQQHYATASNELVRT